MSCPSCGLSSYAVTPHSTASPCPYCDAELFPRIVREGAAAAAAATSESDATTAAAGAAAEIEAEAA